MLGFPVYVLICLCCQSKKQHINEIINKYLSVWAGSSHENVLTSLFGLTCILLPEESVESDDEDNLSQVMRKRATIPWHSCCTYLSSAGLPLLALLLLSQLLKHSLMVAIDYWLARWTSHVIMAKIEAKNRNCTVAQVRRRAGVWFRSQWTMLILFSRSSPLRRF